MSNFVNDAPACQDKLEFVRPRRSLHYHALTMPCLIAALALVAPRVTIVLLVIFSNYIGNAYNTMIFPLIGFFIFPFTTIAYAFAINTNGSVSGIYLVPVIFAVLLDLGAMGGGYSQRTVFVERRPN